MIKALFSRAMGLWRTDSVRTMLRGMAWTTGAVVAERLIALGQTYFISHSLGIAAFGQYGLLFTTIGMVSALAGLQLGLTAAIAIARLRLRDPVAAAGAMRMAEILALFTTLIVAGGLALAPKQAAEWLLGDAAYAQTALAALGIAAISVASGVQEGILQGFERFRSLAVLRVVSALGGLLLVIALIKPGDLESVIIATFWGVVLRLVMLLGLKEWVAGRAGLIAGWKDTWAARKLVVSFSIPSVLASLLVGLANWFGLFQVSRAPQGFAELAVLTAGQQWRGMAMYLAATAATVAMPMMSRLTAQGDQAGAKRLLKLNIVANAGLAIGIAVVTILASPILLGSYGDGFNEGLLAFCITILGVAPMVVSQTLTQWLVSQGLMWEQLRYYLVLVVPQFILFFLFSSGGAFAYAIIVGITYAMFAWVLGVRLLRPHHK